MEPLRIKPRDCRSVEWPTLLLIAGCSLAWCLATSLLAEFSVWLAFPIVSILITLHSSLQHEVLHGHPVPSRFWSQAMVFPAPGLFIPYLRFRDTHLQHHVDPRLTDPYEDPETNYLDPEVWNRLAPPVRLLLRFNASLAGRMIVGPLVSQIVFMRNDLALIRQRSPGIIRAWVLHGIGMVPVVAWIVWASPMSLGSYVLAAYCGLSLLKIRTFLEHRAHFQPRGRTVIVADRGLLAFLFLNNNLHLVHHMHPSEPWYRLPELFRRNSGRYLDRNSGYLFNSYLDVFRDYLIHAKDPVPHPIWRRDGPWLDEELTRAGASTKPNSTG